MMFITVSINNINPMNIKIGNIGFILPSLVFIISTFDMIPFEL